MKPLFSLLIFLLAGIGISAQQAVTGTVTDSDGQPLIGVNITEDGTTRGTISGTDGTFSMSVTSLEATLVFTYIGYQENREALNGRNKLNLTMTEGVTLGEIKVVGSRSLNRSSTNSAVPIDVIDIADVQSRSGQVEINQILQYAAPSFNASKQSGSDGADHIDPATLRGLGPDQTLVLINGKRRHQSSLINVFGSRGRGNTGTDLNAIPVSAIKRVEVLRDGASAQYGSDAIAGVVNIVLQDQVNQLTGNISYGMYNTNADGDFADGTPNASGENRLYDKDRSMDGNTLRVAANYGMPIGSGGGFANISTEIINKDRTLRPGAEFRRGYGEAALDGFNLMINSAIPIGKQTEVYAFGGRNFRNTDAYAFTRNNPTARNVLSIYPNGFTPRITSNITDVSASAGLRHKLNNGWNVDFNNTYGKNDFHYYIKNTLNASLEDASPTDFDAGGHSLAQNTTGLDFSKYFGKILAGANLAFGAEYRTENFIIFSGDEGSYATYDVNGLPITGPNQTIPVDAETGEERPGGSQGFPGYSPANEVDRHRSNLAFYIDGELDVTKRFLINAALRYEEYSDFGETFNYKLAARYKIIPSLAIRASVSSGFRAPSLAQIYYNLRFTNFVGGTAEEVLLAPNNSPVTRGFGISALKEESALNGTVGLTWSSGSFSATVDGYLIDIKDRIVLTDYFDASQLGLNVVSAQFFANGIDTRTTGIDVVLNWSRAIQASRLSISLLGNFNKMEIEDVNSGNLDPDVFFGPREQAFLKASAPEYKVGLNIGYAAPKWQVNANLTQYSEVTILGWEAYESDDDFGGYPGAALDAAKDVYDPAMVLDLSVGVNLTPKLKLTLGVNNLLNAYPTVQDADWTDGGGYWDSVQMGTAGAYYFGRLGFTF